MVEKNLQDGIDGEQQENVVIIEERNKTFYLYIAISAVLGIAIGGLGGAIVTNNNWQEVYLSQKEMTETRAVENLELQQQLSAYEEDTAKAKELALKKQADELNAAYQKQLQELRISVTELEKVNIEQETLISKQGTHLENLGVSNQRLNRQADLQASVFERSREVFQREMLIRQELDRLFKEKKELLPKKTQLVNECDDFLAGSTWQANSNVCDKSDEVNSELSQIDQLIEIHKLDLEQIKALSEGMGLTN